MKIYPYNPLYHISLPKNQKEFFASKKSLSVLKLLRVFIDGFVFRFHSDRALFRFLIDRILFRVLRVRVFFKSSAKGSSSRSIVTDYFLGSSALFFRHAAICFFKSCYYLFSRKKMFYFALYSQKEIYS